MRAYQQALLFTSCVIRYNPCYHRS